MIEKFLLLWRAAPTPEQHLLGDDLVAALALLDDVAAAEEEQGRLHGDLVGANDGGARGAFVLAGEACSP